MPVDSTARNGLNDATTRQRAKGVGVLAFVSDVWGDNWQPRHYVLSGLADRIPVLWVSAPTYVEGWRRSGMGAALAGRGMQKVSDRLWCYAPRLPADYKRRYVRQGVIPSLFRQYNRWWRRRQVGQIKRLLRAMGIERVVLYLWNPAFHWTMGEFNEIATWYHIDDDYAHDPERDHPIGDDEMKLLKGADAVFIHSRTLMRKKGSINPNTHYVPNGVDFELYQSAMRDTSPLPSELSAIPGPRIGYTGHIKQHLDLDLVRTIAEARPDWSLVLVGPVRRQHPDVARAVEQLQRLPNVHLLGRKPYDTLPHYVRGFDVCLMCYKKTHYTKYIYPMKLHEYLACGKPIVSTPLENIMEFGDVLHFADEPTAWVAEISAALSDPAEELVDRRVGVARRNSWASRVDRIWEQAGESVELQNGTGKGLTQR